MNQDVIVVQEEFLNRGIAKYEGKIDIQINQVLKAADMPYTAYRFNDGRLLLIFVNDQFGILYRNEQVLFEKLHLDHE